MSFPMLTVLDLARLDLNDAKIITSTSTDDTQCRHPDSELIRYANDGIVRATVIRPDLNYGNYSNAYVDLTTASNFPLPIEYRDAIAQYVIGRAETGDDPFAVEQRAIQSLKLYMQGLGLGGG